MAVKMQSVVYYLKFFMIFTVAFFVRLFLIRSDVISKTLGDRAEISTPLNSWKQAVEGVSLYQQGVNPYDSDAFHESPMALLVYKYFITEAPEYITNLFVVCDLITAVFLTLASKLYLCNLRKREEHFADSPNDVSCLLLQPEKENLVPYYVAAIYLFCPFAVASCAGKSTVVFLNLIIAAFILSACSGMWLLASILLGIISYHSFYFLSCLIPLILMISQEHQLRGKELKIWKTAAIILVFIFTITSLVAYSYKVVGSWQFIQSTYGFVIFVPDLTPNIGLFWYFFTEMFEHFRLFFLWTFQLNAFIYTLPLAVRFRKEPMLLLFILTMLIAIFKSYPCIGDVVIYFSLLPVWSHFFSFMRQSFLVGCVLASCSFLAPTLWHLWLYSGSANANFYFAITLAFNTGQIFLLTDILSAFIKREYYLLNGPKADEDGKLLVLRLR